MLGVPSILVAWKFFFSQLLNMVKQTMKKFLEFIFSVKNHDIYKIVTILGVKFRIKSKSKQLQQIQEKLDTLTEILRHSIDITKIPPAQDVTGDIQKASLIVLKKFDQICRKHNIKYWLEFGTLLGAVRHKGFIPWDDDLDVGMMIDDYKKFLAVVDEELKNSDVCFVNVPSEIGKLTHKEFTPHTDEEISKFIFWQLENKLAFALDVYPHYYAKSEISKEELNETLRNCYSNKDKIFHNFKDFDDFTKARFWVDECNKKLASDSPTNLVYLGVERIPPYPVTMDTNDIFPLKEMQFEGISCYVPNNSTNLLTDIYGDYISFPSKMQRHIRTETLDKRELKKLRKIISQPME